MTKGMLARQSRRAAATSSLVVLLSAGAAYGQAVVSLFDGSSLNGWIVERNRAEAGAGVLTVRNGTGWVRSDKVFMDFTLKLEVRIAPGARAVVFVRAWPTFDAKTTYPDNGYRVTLDGSDPATAAGSQPPRWRQLEIECTGSTLRAKVDGTLLEHVDTVENPQGYIALSAQAGNAEFRNIEVTRASPPKLQPPEGTYAPGAGIEAPRVIKQVKPKYTAEAMAAKIQGGVWLTGVVLPDGTVSDIRIVQSLDPRFGLDNSAVAALQEWRFAPGTMNGKPVPVFVTVSLIFTLR